jgi:hypothetical protein
MTIRTFFTILAILSFLFGLGLLLAPGQVLANYGIEHSPALALVGRLSGGALLTLGVKRTKFGKKVHRLIGTARNYEAERVHSSFDPPCCIGCGSGVRTNEQLHKVQHCDMVRFDVRVAKPAYARSPARQSPLPAR